MIEYLLISDGTSDRLLINPIDWVFRQKGVQTKGRWLDFSKPEFQSKTLEGKLSLAKQLYTEIDFIIIHRDAENQPIDKRKSEINDVINKASIELNITARIVPIRMSEAWLLIDESAIRRAAGKPSGKIPLGLPKIKKLEQISDPKDLLKEYLLKASELSGRKRNQFDFNNARQLVSQFIIDFTPLRSLVSFTNFESEIDHLLKIK